jgi:phosphocarrier protein HPr
MEATQRIMAESADTQVYRRRVVVKSPHGLHMRPCTIVAKTASQFDSRVRLRNVGKQADAKSIMDLLTLAAELGTELDLEVDGPDAPDALEHLAALFDSDFAPPEPVTAQPPAAS